mmetsp:Transcript_30852/g.66811  ORF Transcript_30852/g.66811 Transcript_30852/m.66811 type:complete len:80 (-) Transcript_30852:1117-1356(-)
MCEFCSFGPNSSRRNHGDDGGPDDAFGATGSSMGFFSSDAIEAAVRQANEARGRGSAAAAAAQEADEEEGGGGYDSDGT